MNEKVSIQTEEDILNIVITILQKYLVDKNDKVDSTKRFDRLGLDSMNTLLFIADLEENLSKENMIEIDLPVLLQNPTPKELAAYIYKNKK